MALGKNLNNILGDYFGDNVSLDENNSENSSNSMYRQINIENQSASQSEVRHIPVEKVVLNPYQTRTQFDFEKIQSLANSIKENGLLSPIVVVKKEDHYVLIAGERRLRATKLLNQEEILAFVKEEGELTEQQQVMITATENLQREDLSPIELAYTYKTLIEVLGFDERQLAEKLGVTSQYVKNYLRLLSLSRPVQKALLEKKIGEGHARHLVGLSEEQQETMVNLIIERDLSVREIVEYLRKLDSSSKVVTEPAKVQEVLTPNLAPGVLNGINYVVGNLPNSKVKYSGNERKGKVVISWSSK